MKIEEINTFEEFVKYQNNYKYIIVNISAPWCKPCKEIKPKIEKFFSVIDKNEYIYLKIDHDVYISNENFESLFNVSKIPYFCIMKDKKVQYSIVSGDLFEVSSNLYKYISLNNNEINNFNINDDF